MKLNELYESSEEVEKFLFEMANLRSKQTGIERVVIWASQAQDGAKRHGPRVKVSSHPTESAKIDDFFVLTIQDEPQLVAGDSHLSADVMQDVRDWITKNKEVLLNFWNGELFTDEFLELVEKV